MNKFQGLDEYRNHCNNQEIERQREVAKQAASKKGRVNALVLAGQDIATATYMVEEDLDLLQT